jgi:hypothetical protein
MLRAFIQERFAGSVAVSLVRGEFNYDGHPMVARLVGDGFTPRTTWETVEDPHSAIEPTLILGEEEARVLLDALAHHYEGSSDMRLLQKDRDHERGRVDKLLDVVAEIAKGRP